MFYKILYYVISVVFRLLYRVKFIGRENLPEGRAVMCCNHSNANDPVFGAIALRPRDKVVFFAKSEFFRNKILAFLFKIVNVHKIERGTADISAIKFGIRALQEEKKIFLYPEGTRIKEDLEAERDIKGGIGIFSVKGNAPLVPMYLTPNKHFFGKVKMVIGKPIYPKDYADVDKKDLYQTIADDVFAEIVRLGKEHG